MLKEVSNGVQRRRAGWLIAQVSAITIASISTSAMAQSSPATRPDAAASEAETDGGVAEIVVTAQKRSQNLQNVPVAISAVDGDALERANLDNVTDLGRIVPSLTLTTTSGAVQPFLRGIGSAGSILGNEASVAFYLDGVYLARVPQTLLQLNSIERVEVLKGPQGTLFGRNASGGLIHVITRDPSETPAFEGKIGYGNYETVTGSVYATTGLAPNLAIDVTAMISDQGKGWGFNRGSNREWGKVRSEAVRSKLKWTPSENTTILLIGDYNHSDGDVLPHSQYTFDTATRGYTIPPYGLQTGLGFYDIEADAHPVNVNENWGVSAKIDQDLGFGTFTSITAYRKNTERQLFDADFTSQDVFAAGLAGRGKQFSQEVQLASNKGSSFDWLVGAFYLDSEGGYEPSTFTGAAIGPGVAFQRYGVSKVKSYAVYAQGTYELVADTNLTLGARYTTDKLSGEGRDDVALIGGPVIFPGAIVSGSQTFNKFTYKATLDHRFNSDLMVYATQSRGFKAGVYNTLPFAVPAAQPETLDASEIGFKSTLFDRKLRLNGAGFYYGFKNAQFQAYNGPSVLIINAAKARIWGAEIEAEFAPTRGLNFRAGAGYLNSKYTSFTNAQTIVPNPGVDPTDGHIGGYLNGFLPFDASGNDMIRVPKWTLNLGGSYDIDTAAGGFGFDVNWSYNDGFAWDADNRLKQPSYSLVDAGLKWTPPGAEDRYTVRLWVKNITKEKYYVSEAQSDGARGPSALPGAPRTFGAELSIKM